MSSVVNGFISTVQCDGITMLASKAIILHGYVKYNVAVKFQTLRLNGINYQVPAGKTLCLKACQIPAGKYPCIVARTNNDEYSIMVVGELL